jgi:hypothetical protein
MHVVPANGGGVDRYVRDICSQRHNDVVVHVSARQVVIEQITPSEFFPVSLDDNSFADFLESVGTPALIHAHSTLPETRDLVSKMCAANLELRYILTLHDVKFADEACPLPERESRLTFARKATAFIAPSAYIAALAKVSLESAKPLHVIANGVNLIQDENIAPSVVTSNNTFPIAVVGALGQHKGLQFLREIVARLPSATKVVLIGYAEDHLTASWIIEDKLWVHGPFQPQQTKALLGAYGCSFVLFPNRQPESYSYTLSDVWCAGRPALVPDSGALGERVLSTGAGWRYPAAASAEAVASMALNCLLEHNELAKLQTQATNAAKELPTVAFFVDALNKIYSLYMLASVPSFDSNRIKKIVSPHLDAHFFREELLRVSGDLDFALKQRDKLSIELKQLGDEHQTRGEWMEKLDRDIGALNAELDTMRAALDSSARAHAADVEKLSRDVTETLAAAHRFERALSALPRLARRWALRRADAQSNQKNSP